MSDDELKQLKAYKVGYDLGWYRAFESISNDLTEIADAIINSATFKEIERENRKQPMFLGKILNIIGEVKEMRDENLPTLLIHRQAITSLGSELQKVLKESPKLLDDTKLVENKLLSETDDHQQ